MSKKQIVVIGKNDCSVEEENIGYEVGKYLAEKGCVIITGGKSGMMEAVSKGAKSEGGLTIGIIPDADRQSANSYCDVVIPTGIGYARNIINILAGDVIVAIGGGSGTLSEIAYAWQYGKKIIAFKNVEGWSKTLADKPIDDRRTDTIIGVDDIDEFKIVFERMFS